MHDGITGVDPIEFCSRGARATALALWVISRPLTLNELAWATRRSRRSVKRDVAELIEAGAAERRGKPSRYTTPTYAVRKVTWASFFQRGPSVKGPGTTEEGRTTMTSRPCSPSGNPLFTDPEEQTECAPAQEPIGREAAMTFRRVRTAALADGHRSQRGMESSAGSIAKQLERDGIDRALILRAVADVAGNVNVSPKMIPTRVDQLRSGGEARLQAARDRIAAREAAQ